MKALIKSFGYAFAGIGRTIRTERNMRIHLVVTLYMYGYLLLYDFFEVSRTGFAVLFLANALVMMGEMVNTAVENVVDLVEQKKKRLLQSGKRRCGRRGADRRDFFRGGWDCAALAAAGISRSGCILSGETCLADRSGAFSGIVHSVYFWLWKA